MGDAPMPSCKRPRPDFSLLDLAHRPTWDTSGTQRVARSEVTHARPRQTRRDAFTREDTMTRRTLFKLLLATGAASFFGLSLSSPPASQASPDSPPANPE